MKPAKKKDKKDKKKKFWGQKREYIGEQKEQTLAAGVNTTDISKKKKKRHNISKIMYLNCDKKGHYTNNYTEPKN